MDFPKEFPAFFQKYRSKGLYLVISDETIIHATGDTSLVFCDVTQPVDVVDVVPALFGAIDDEGVYELVSAETHDPVDIFYQRHGDYLLAYLSDVRSAVHAIVDKQQMRNEMHLMNQELKTKNAYIERIHHLQTQFVSSISHEFRTPITSVLGNLELVQHKHDRSGHFEREAVDAAYASASYLSLMINNVLDYASSSLNHLIITQATADSRQLIHEIKQMFTIQAKQKKLDLRVEVDESVPDTFVGDAIRIKQVLVNLVSNAIKYTAKGHVRVNVSADDKQLVFSVTDTGKGIAKEQQANIFQPFVRETSNQYMAMGAGLGLTIAKTLAEKMNGALSLTSELGKGSTFSFTVPYKVDDKHSVTTNHGILDSDDQVVEGGLSSDSDAEQAVIVQTPPDDFTCLEGRNVLIAEDNDDVADLLYTMLGLYGCKVRRATNGQMALELAKQYTPDIVLMDINMPKLNGLQASIELRKMELAIPMIGLSASINLGEDLQQYAKYFDRVCSKPFKIDELLHLMCDLIRVSCQHEDSIPTATQH